MLRRIDVTNEVAFSELDEHALQLMRCVCGERYKDWSRIVGDDAETARPCRACGARLVFSVSVRVFKLEED